MPGFDRERVLALAALASSEADQDPIDAAIRRAAADTPRGATPERLVRFVPSIRRPRCRRPSRSIATGTSCGSSRARSRRSPRSAQMPGGRPGRRRMILAAHGHRVIAVAAGPPASLRLAGLIALSDPPREDSAGLIAALRDMGVRTVMVTGDSAVTAAAIARKVGIAGAVCPPERLSEDAEHRPVRRVCARRAGGEVPAGEGAAAGWPRGRHVRRRHERRAGAAAGADRDRRLLRDRRRQGRGRHGA